DPAVGQAAAMESRDELKEALKGADMIFITAGEGGGTGTGAAPILASLVRELGALTVGVVTKPFAFEGRKRAQQAEQGIEALRDRVDTRAAVEDANIIVGAVIEESLGDEVCVTVIATGFGGERGKRRSTSEGPVGVGSGRDEESLEVPAFLRAEELKAAFSLNREPT